MSSPSSNSSLSSKSESDSSDSVPSSDAGVAKKQRKKSQSSKSGSSSPANLRNCHEKLTNKESNDAGKRASKFSDDDCSLGKKKRKCDSEPSTPPQDEIQSSLGVSADQLTASAEKSKLSIVEVCGKSYNKDDKSSIKRTSFNKNQDGALVKQSDGRQKVAGKGNNSPLGQKSSKYKRSSRSMSKDRNVRRKSRSRSRNFDENRDKRGNKSTGGNDSEKVERGKDNSRSSGNAPEKITERQRRTVDLLTSRTGGAYIPPAKLRMLQAEITDKSSAAYQRIAWEALKKSIHGYINKVNVDNIGIITRELLKENIIRGRGLLCRSIIQAQAASPTFTHVYAALVAIINSKFPNIGELLLKRLVIQFKRGFRRNDKSVCISSSRFIAHLVNQRVAHEILALEILTLLVETPTDDSVEVAIAFLKECGMKLTEVSAKGVNAIFEMLKNILHEGKLDKRVQYMIEVVFQVRKDGFKDHQSVIEALELVEEDDQFTHLIMLDEATDAQDNLNVFRFDDKYETNEDKYKGLSKELLGSDASDSESGSSGSGSDSENEDNEDHTEKGDVIIDNTETNLVALRRTIYLTIHSSLDYEECAHKLMKMELKPGQEMELCHMFLDCCAEQRTYEKFFGLLAQRFCMINKIYIQPFEEIFRDTYHTTHRLDTNRLRNVSKFFAHLLFTDAIGWDVLECIKLNEDDTTSSSRIFIKILFQELAEYLGLSKLNERLKDATLAETFAGLFPRDNPRNTRFAINFFTSIGLGGLTDELREFLKSAPKSVPAINQEILGTSKSDSSSSSSSSTSSSSSSSTSSSSDSSTSSSSSSDSDESGKKKSKKQRKRKISRKRLHKRKQKGSSSSSSEDESDGKSKYSKTRQEGRVSSHLKRNKHNEKEIGNKYKSNKNEGKVCKESIGSSKKVYDEKNDHIRKHREKSIGKPTRKESDDNKNRQFSPGPERWRRYDREENRQESRRNDRYRDYRDEPKESHKSRACEEGERSRSRRKSSRGISKERG